MAIINLRYDGTSVRELNQALGVSHNLINRRFGSKERLWRAVVDRWFGELVDALAPSAILAGDADPLERLREFLDYIFERFITPCLLPAAAVAAKLQAEGKMRHVPAGTLFFLIAHGATAPAAHRPLAALLAMGDPTDPATVRIHARAVAQLLIQPAA